MNTKMTKTHGSFSAEEFSLRYFSGDEHQVTQVLTLLKICFGIERTLGAWKWRYSENPFQKPVIVLAMDLESDELIGHQSITPVKVNIRGGATSAGQSGDSMVHPGSRGLGIFNEALLQSQQESEKQGMALVFGFPGPQSAAAFLQKCGWEKVCIMQEYTLLLSVFDKLKSLVPVPFLASIINSIFLVITKAQNFVCLQFLSQRMYKAVSYEETDKVPKDYDTLWSQVRRSEVFSIWKDSEYFSWRYDKRPDVQYRYHCLRFQGVLVAVAVTRREEETATILEFMVSEKNSQWAKYLALRLVQHALKNGAQKARFVGYDDGFFREAFSRFRFRQLYHQIFCIRSFQSPAHPFSGITLASNWTVTHGDWDGV